MEDFHFDQYFSDGLVQPPTRYPYIHPWFAPFATHQGFSCTCSRCDSARYGPRGSYVPGIKVRKLRKAIKTKGLPGLLAISSGVSVGWHHSICQVTSGKIFFLWLSYDFWRWEIDDINTTGSTRPSVFAWHPVDRYICLLAFNVLTMRSLGKEFVFERAGFCLHRFGWWF